MDPLPSQIAHQTLTDSPERDQIVRAKGVQAAKQMDHVLDPEKTKFHDKLNFLQHYFGYTNKELRKGLGISRSRLRNLQTGDELPNEKDKEKIASFFRVPQEELITESQELTIKKENREAKHLPCSDPH